MVVHCQKASLVDSVALNVVHLKKDIALTLRTRTLLLVPQKLSHISTGGIIPRVRR